MSYVTKKILVCIALILAICLTLASCGLVNGEKEDVKELLDGKTVAELYDAASETYESAKNYSLSIKWSKNGSSKESVSISLVYGEESFSANITTSVDKTVTVESFVYKSGKLYYIGKDGSKHLYNTTLEDVVEYVFTSTAIKDVEPAFPKNHPASWFKDLNLESSGNGNYFSKIEIDEAKSKEHQKHSDFYKPGAVCKFYFTSKGVLDSIDLKHIEINGEKDDITVKFNWDNSDGVSEPGDKESYPYNGDFSYDKGHKPGEDLREEHTHVFGEWYGNTATCTSGGEERRDCTDCEYFETRKTEPTEHNMVALSDREPTCTEPGYRNYKKCSDCDYSTYEKIPALQHDLIHHEGKPATCQEPGYEPYDECTRCDFSTYMEIPGGEHQLGEWYGVTATCTEDGTIRRDCLCEGCDYYETEYAKALGHDEVWHDYKAPTCEEAGHNEYVTCSRCDYTTYEEIPANGHKLGNWKNSKLPTCTEAGSRYRSCSEFGCKYTETEEVAPKGHDEIKHEGRTPTCTNYGYDEYVTCSRCSYTTYKEYDALGHDEVSYQHKAATCTEDGHSAYTGCTRCDYTRNYRVIAAKGHLLSDWGNNTATCLLGGEERRSCGRAGCGYYETQPTSALGHDITAHEAKAETCTEVGYEAYEDCSRCDYTTYKEIEALGHDEINHEAKAETCTVSGHNAYVTCSRCDYTTYEKIEAPGHKYENDVCTVCGLDRVSEGLKYELSEDGTYYIVVGIGTCKDLDIIVPPTYNELPVTAIGASAFSDRTAITGITLLENITCVGDYAFKGCTALSKVVLSDSLTSIGRLAFQSCEALTSIVIPTGVTSIGNYAFINCFNLDEVYFNAVNLEGLNSDSNLFAGVGQTENGIKLTVGNKVKQLPAYLFFENEYITSVEFEEGSVCEGIGNCAFYFCENLVNVKLPGSLRAVGSSSFAYCSKITNITIPDGVTSIGTSAFNNCANLANADIPNSVVTIGERAFYQCKALTEITIPESVTQIGEDAFAYCSLLEEIKFNATSLGDVAAGSDIFYLSGENVGELKLTVGKKVTRIPANLFYGHYYLASVEFEEGGVCTSIGESAFRSCKMLTSITIPESIVSIENYAFCDCLAVESITFNAIAMSDLIYSINQDDSNYVFYRLGQNTDGIKVVIGKNVTRIPTALFYPHYYYSYIPKITSVEFEEGSVCESIGEYAFYKCATLTDINLPSSLISIGNNAFYECTSLASVDIPNSVTDIGSYAFAGTAITEITIHEQVEYMGSSVFYDCVSLSVVYFNANLSEYKGGVLGDVKDGAVGARLIIGKNVTKIPDNLFLYSGIITVLEFEQGSICESIGYSAFERCTRLKSITIPETVTKMEYKAFKYCVALEEIRFNAVAMADLPSGSMTEARNEVFLEAGINGAGIKLTVGKNVTRIPASLFWPQYIIYNNYQPPKISIVEFEEGSVCESIGNSAFEHCASLVSINIPDSVKSIGASAFYYCITLTNITLPDSVTVIGGSAFEYCMALTSIIIPRGVTEIKGETFNECYNLTSITLHEGITEIKSAFSNCYKLVEIINKSSLDITAGSEDHGGIAQYARFIHDGDSCIVNVDDYLFITVDGVNYLLTYTGAESELVLPESYKGSSYETYDYAFYELYNLTSVVISDGVTAIGKYAFAGCDNLKSAFIGKGVAKIDCKAFYGCNALDTISVDTDNTYYKDIDGNLYSKDGTVIVRYASGKTDTEFTIPNCVVIIGDYAFSASHNLINVVMPSSVTVISNYVFYNCINMKCVTVSENVTIIGDCAFYYCKELTDVNIPEGVTAIGGYAFSDCQSLTSVVIPDSVTDIGNGAFYSCTELRSLTIGKGVTSIGNSAFYGCYALEEIYFNAVAVEDLPGEYNGDKNNYTFAKSGINGMRVVIGKDVTRIPAYLFCPSDSGVYVANVISVEFEEGSVCQSIGMYAFAYCENLTTITIPISVTDIHTSAFNGSNTQIIRE